MTDSRYTVDEQDVFPEEGRTEALKNRGNPFEHRLAGIPYTATVASGHHPSTAADSARPAPACRGALRLRPLATILLTLAAVIGMPAPSMPHTAADGSAPVGSPPALASWLEGEFMTGTWGGLRTKLGDLGIVPSLFTVIDVQGNPVGGDRQKLRDFQYTGLDLAVDLERLWGWNGSRFQLSTYWGSGHDLSLDIGNFFGVAETCCVDTFRLVDLWFEQSWARDLVNVRLGRMTAGDEFLTSPLFLYFVQASINFNPIGIFFNVPFSTYPLTTWGARLRIRPIEQLSLMAGLYNGDPGVEDNDNHGTDFSFRGPLFAIFEIGYRLNQEEGATGLPGNYRVGAFYHDGEYPRLLSQIMGRPVLVPNLPARTSRGNGGFYVLLDQMVHRGGDPESERSLTAFLSVVISPDQSRNPLPYFVNAGVVVQGPIRGRPDDAALFGVSWGRFSDAFRRLERAGRLVGLEIVAPRYELALEWSYAIQVTPWLKFQPDIQYIINPGGTGRVPNALVLGFEVGLTF
jgi:porin